MKKILLWVMAFGLVFGLFGCSSRTTSVDTEDESFTEIEEGDFEPTEIPRENVGTYGVLDENNRYMCYVVNEEQDNSTIGVFDTYDKRIILEMPQINSDSVSFNESGEYEGFELQFQNYFGTIYSIHLVCDLNGIECIEITEK